MADRDQLMQQYKKLAKRANQRMLRLEQRAADQPAVLEWAYASAIHDIESWRGEGETRFPSVAPKDGSIAQLQARIADVEKFLQMPTSRVGVIKTIDRKRVKTLNKKQGTDFTLGDFEYFTRSGMLDKLKQDKYGSKTIWQIVTQIRRNMDTLEKQIAQHKKRNIVVYDEKGNKDPILQKKVDEVLHSTRYGVKLIDVLK